MAWTLLEDLIKTGATLLAQYIFNTIWRCLVPSKKCMIQGCYRSSGPKKGLCLVCYSKAKSKVESGVVTWEKLAELGLCRSDRDAFDIAYEKAVEDKPEDEDSSF